MRRASVTEEGQADPLAAWPVVSLVFHLTLVNAINEEVQGRVGLPCEANMITLLAKEERP